ncbi:MAG: hypothetical protein IKW30_07035 [Lachnospiraceae bacterium]|nr:hypothetical protein [Lachnospiraceae bacterium]
MKKLMFVDAETDGLYGQVLSIGAVVVEENGRECSSFYQKQKIDPDAIQEEWVKENVIPLLGDCVECETEEELLEAFWAFYMENHQCDVIADVPYPVEASLFYKCVLRDEKNRRFLAPFPLLDLSSMLYAKGMDPLISRQELMGKHVQQHNGLVDARMSAEIYFKYIR